MTRLNTHRWRTAALCLLGAALWQNGAAQQAKGDGNIVAIFGQQKVETTDEGRVLHHFRKGLLLPGGVGAGTLYNGQEMVVWLYATARFRTPAAGDSIGYDRHLPQSAHAFGLPLHLV